ncbi:hypothetical protein SAMN05446935_4901 [Burkholderia sp. YR290]|nr:hypothetical protein SAMN05446935_4901 [Burkholderia sp. YR290]
MDKILLTANDRALLASYRDEQGVTKSVDMSIFLRLQAQCNGVLHCLFRYIERGRSRTGRNLLRAAVRLGDTLRRLSVSQLPTTEDEWQALVLAIQREVLTNPDSNASLISRATTTLPLIEELLSHLQLEDWIPAGVKITQTSKDFSKIRQSASNRLIGEKSPTKVINYDAKLLCGVSTSRTDAAYLDEMRSGLLSRRTALHEALEVCMKTMMAYAEYGKTLMASVDKDELFERLERHEELCRSRSRFDKNSVSFCSLGTEKELAEYLVVIKHRFGGLPTTAQSRTQKCVPTFPDPSYQLPIPIELAQVSQQAGCERVLFDCYADRVRWMLGRLVPHDISMLAALLMMEEPRFTPEATTFAKLYDDKGYRLIEFADGGGRFSVSKHRAKSLKTEQLSELGYEIINFAIECSDDIRPQLRKDGSPLGDLLFIPFNRNGAVPSNPSHERYVGFLSGSAGGRDKPWIGDVLPELESAGLGRGSINFARIRHTEGVLEWFRTGSERAMARKLGNQPQTCIDSYIPPPLLRAWNTRLIRRFHNLWICVAAASDDWLLEVTDFSSIDELHSFLLNMLSEHKRDSSPLAEELHVRFERAMSTVEKLDDSDESSWLAISISKNSLASLYLYLDIFSSKGSDEHSMDSADSVTHMRPRQFIDLAVLLRNRLPLENNPDFRKIHIEAESLVQNLREKVNWESFLFRSVEYES